MTITGGFSSVVLSLLRLAGQALARGKGFLTNRPELPAAREENVGALTNLSGGDDDLSSGNAATMASEARNDADPIYEDFAKEGEKIADAAWDDDSFGFPRFDVQHSLPDHQFTTTLTPRTR